MITFGLSFSNRTMYGLDSFQRLIRAYIAQYVDIGNISIFLKRIDKFIDSFLDIREFLYVSRPVGKISSI